MDIDEIWQAGGPLVREGFWGFQPITPTPGYRVHKGGTGCLWSLSHVFWKSCRAPLI